MRPSPLHLEGYYVRELFVELNAKFEKRSDFISWGGYHYQPGSDFKPDACNFDVDGYAARNVKDPFRVRYRLVLSSAKNSRRQVPYNFRISLVGFFHIDKNYPADRASVLFYANAPGILYAAAREVLATAMARGPYPAIILPSASFLDDAEQLALHEAKQLKRQLKGKAVKAKRASKKKTVKKKAG